MSDPIEEKWSKGVFSFWEDGDIQYEGYDRFLLTHLEPNEAVNLASALLQYATQNGAGRG